MTPWVKIYRDLWINRSRTVLIILSIAVGVFAIGLIGMSQMALIESLNEQYAAMRPADAILHTEPMLDEDFVEGIRHMRGVEEAEGRRYLPLRISLDGKGETWRDLTLYALHDYEDQRLFLVRPLDGIYPPEKGQVLMERASLDYIGAKPGDQILVKTPDGREFHLTVTGRVHDLYRIPPVIEGWIYGYVDMSTFRWMGEAEGFNELYVRYEDPTQVHAMTNKVADRIEGIGLPVYQKTLPKPDEHPLKFIIDTILVLLGVVAVLSMFLSVMLVVNVISALIAQQEKQIAIMKAIGGRSWQVVGLYFSMVFILGLIACAVAIPLSFYGAGALAAFAAAQVNFDPPTIQFTWQALLFQLGVGLFVPLLAAAPTILSGTNVAPARVLSEYGISQVWGGVGVLDKLLNRLPAFTRDTLLALRNPFRKRGRLILSLITLTFAGAVFMAIVNLRGSLNGALNEMFGFWRYDAWIIVDDQVPAKRLVTEAQSVAGVTYVEAWGFAMARYVRPDGSESGNLYLLAPPAGTPLLDPPIIEGRDLRPGDVNALVVSPGLLADEPSLHVGSEMTLKIDGREQTYRIVGVINMMSNATLGYFTIMDYDAYTRHVREPNRSNTVILNYDADTLAEQRAITSAVEKRFDRADIEVVSTFLVGEEREEINSAFAIIAALLMVMTILLATVGSLGLMGTMSLNVMERVREIGVMRAFGASSRAISRIVIIEGLLIGMMSWILAIVLSLPISSFLARIIGLSFMDYPMTATSSPGGILIWALIVIAISILASLFPALRAARMTVTEVLAYE